MQVDGVHALPAGDDEDDGSLFGSPPPSPARGRSPQLALPAGPGPTENVGTIALPGSHYCSELAIDPAVLLFNRPLPQRNPDTPTVTSTPTLTPTPTPTHFTPPSTLSTPHRPATSRGASRAPRNPRNGRARSATPHPPTPPIHFPDPDEPLPPNFLRSQQALLGHAGLIGGLDPSTLSTRHHRGTTSQNPIIVENELDPPPLGKGDTYSLDSSLLPSPPSEEVVSSLVKQRNIFPVLESLLRLLSGTGVSSLSPAVTPSCLPTPSDSNAFSKECGVAPKRRRLNSVPAGAADWDVPYPFQQGEGPTQYHLRWEKERLRQLLSQLAVVVKGAKRSAAARTYLQQHADLWSSINPPMPQGQTSDQQQPTGVSFFEHDVPACPSYVEDVAPVPTVSETPRQRLQTPAAAPQTAPLDLVTSLLYNSMPRVSSPSNLTSSSSSDSLLHHPPCPSSRVTTYPMSSRASSAALMQGPAASATTPTEQIVSLSDPRRQNQGPPSGKALNKQEIIQRAKYRRRQLETELEKAKVELWETTIEQGVLNHLMKDHGCL
ncbi:hypothetical protein DFH94DRAFT_710416 [Russula ochroleuca]|jgi:hypothetical protein|uniref:Uncharacterized protein n=1 Tax=Russula ochroleuca TaxID=152965 RepID=A0A9P5TD44_9AGAM|nr:hypothetical protein DFH94DRAFT_710416 [Russula ochroleuca]